MSYKEFLRYLKENQEVRHLFKKEFTNVARRYADVVHASKAIHDHLRGIENASRPMTPEEEHERRVAADAFGIDLNKKWSNKPKGYFRSPLPTDIFTSETGARLGVSRAVPHQDIKNMGEKANNVADQLRTRLVSMNPELGEFKNHLQLAQHLGLQGHLTDNPALKSHPVQRIRRGEDLGSTMFGWTTNNPLKRLSDQAGPKSNLKLKQIMDRGGNQHVNPSLHNPDLIQLLTGKAPEEHLLHESFNYSRWMKTLKKNAPRVHYEKQLNALAALAGRAEALYHNAEAEGRVPGEKELNFENKPEELEKYQSAVKHRDEVLDAWELAVSRATNAGHDFQDMGVPSGEEVISRSPESLAGDIITPKEWGNVKGKGSGPYARHYAMHRTNIPEDERSHVMKERICYRLMNYLYC